MVAINLALRFFLELAGIAALGYAGFQISSNALVRWLVAVGAPLVLIVAWALLVAPNTENGLSQPVKDVVGTVLLLSAAGALGIAGQVRYAAIFGIAVLINGLLLFVLGREAFG